MSRVSVVTGAASGNGRAIASRLLNCGDRVAALDVSVGSLERRRADEWDAYTDRVLCLVTDVTDEASVSAAIAKVKDRFGRVDVLVNNAGITGNMEATTVHATPVAEFDRVIAINLRGVFLGCREVLPLMIEQGGGVIINIASVAGLVAFPGRAAYTASKGAVIQLSRSITADYAHAGIRCVALCPGMIETPMTQWRLDQPHLRKEVLARIPQNEIGSVEDVASAVVFLAGPEARYFNGSALVMDGGYAAV
jgi:NAD(P)-dependent dehydrogenase (short-subunit alcohol dehydrogenase family)